MGLAQKIKTIHQIIPNLKKNLLERGENPKYPISSLPGLNRKIWGFRPGLTTIGARTSQGKTALALQIADDFASQGIRTLYITLEMIPENLLERLFCMKQSIDNFELLKGGLSFNPDIQNAWNEFEKNIEKKPLFIIDKIGSTFEELNNLVELFDPAPQVIFIDYIQSIRQVKDERLEINEYVRKFRELMLKKNMVGVLLSQMNRMTANNLDKKPGLENFKNTGVLEEHSDLALILFWEYFYTHDESKKNIYEIIIAKNNTGRTGSYEVKFIPEFYMFKDEEKLKEILTEKQEELVNMFNGKVDSLIGD